MGGGGKQIVELFRFSLFEKHPSLYVSWNIQRKNRGGGVTHQTVHSASEIGMGNEYASVLLESLNN